MAEQNMGNAASSEAAENIQYQGQKAERKVRETLTDINEKLRDSKERMKGLASDIDQRVKENPWSFVGGVAAVSFIIGYFLSGRNR